MNARRDEIMDLLQEVFSCSEHVELSAGTYDRAADLVEAYIEKQEAPLREESELLQWLLQHMPESLPIRISRGPDDFDFAILSPDRAHIRKVMNACKQR